MHHSTLNTIKVVIVSALFMACPLTSRAQEVEKGTSSPTVQESGNVMAGDLSQEPGENRSNAEQAKAVSHLNEALAATSMWKIAALTTGVVAVTLFGLLLWCTRKQIAKINAGLIAEQRHNKDDLHMRERLDGRIAQLQRVESLGDLAGGIAHDFNNLLMGVISNAEAMQNRPGDSQLHAQCLESILQSAEVAAELSRKMLAYAGNRTTEPVIADLNPLVERLVPLVKSTYGFPHEAKFESLTNNAFVKVDVAQIEQVVLNLMTNAVRAVKHGDRNGDGSISISVGRESVEHPENDHLLFGKRSNGGDFVYFEVTDTGVGIADDEISRIFEPFYTRSESGHGIGLAVVFGNVNRHDGFIRCRSTVGEGTSFRILLPESSPPATDEPQGQNLDRVSTTGILKSSKTA